MASPFGLAVGDANGDGLDDVLVCEPGGLPKWLFLQNADGTAVDASAAAALVGLRHAMNTRAPAPASADAIDKPSPEFAPVTSAVLPPRSGRSAMVHRSLTRRSRPLWRGKPPRCIPR